MHCKLDTANSESIRCTLHTSSNGIMRDLENLQVHREDRNLFNKNEYSDLRKNTVTLQSSQRDSDVFQENHGADKRMIKKERKIKENTEPIREELKTNSKQFQLTDNRSLRLN